MVSRRIIIVAITITILILSLGGGALAWKYMVPHKSPAAALPAAPTLVAAPAPVVSGPVAKGATMYTAQLITSSAPATTASQYAASAATTSPTTITPYLLTSTTAVASSGVIQIVTSPLSNPTGSDNSLYIPAGNNVLEITGIPTSVYSGSWTIEFWAMLPTVKSWSDIFNAGPNPSTTKPGTQDFTLNLQVGQNNSMGISVQTLSNNTSTFQANVWYHIAFVYDATSTGNGIPLPYQVYVTPVGGSTVVMLYASDIKTNLGSQLNYLRLGGNYCCAPTSQEMYINNLRVSSTARYSQVASAVFPTTYVPDSSTVYINTFNTTSPTGFTSAEYYYAS